MRPLTREELEECAKAPQFAAVKPEQIFGPNSDGGLANRISKVNLRRYRELRMEWEYISGQKPRPDSYYG